MSDACEDPGGMRAPTMPSSVRASSDVRESVGEVGDRKLSPVLSTLPSVKDTTDRTIRRSERSSTGRFGGWMSATKPVAEPTDVRTAAQGWRDNDVVAHHGHPLMDGPPFSPDPPTMTDSPGGVRARDASRSGRRL